MNRTIFGDCRESMRDLIAAGVRVQMCVTSPPYWGLRDYGCAGQLGLESTPAEYVANLVEVFRLVRDLLADDGVLWLNLGDSYASASKGSGGPSAKQDSNAGSRYESKRLDHGLKDKDLVGIPWRVAFALQQPYYSGRIKDERDRIWLAAMIDGEGCMFLHKRKEGQSNGQGYHRKNDSFGAGMEVANTHESIVKRCMEITGIGSICHQDKGRNQRLFRWNVRSNECRWIVEEVYPHLVAKQHQARLLLGCPSSGERAAAAHAGLILLHNGSPTDVDFPAPASLFKPGYYLRQDVIWSKLNPMPESVTDRCTKAHEYLFLLSKSERYFYNAEAIKEECAPAVYKTPDGWDTSSGEGGHGSFHKNGREKGHIPGNKTHKGTTAYENGDERQRTKAGLVEYAGRQRSKRDDFRRDTDDHPLIPGQSADQHRTERPEAEYDIGKRNKRSVWTIATTPYTGRVRRAGVDGSGRITSLDCPVHGAQGYQASKAVSDAQQAASRSARNPHNGVHPELWPQDERAPIDRRHDVDSLQCSSDSPHLACSETATSHNTGSRKMDHDLSTSRHGIPDAESLVRIVGSERSHGLGASDGRTHESNTVPDCGLDAPSSGPEEQTHSHNVCTCTFEDIIDHFATFPPALVEPCILAGSRPGDIVLDPFFGSGTVGQVAQQLGRQWIGMELNREYERLQLDRTAQAGMVFAEQPAVNAA